MGMFIHLTEMSWLILVALGVIYYKLRASFNIGKLVNGYITNDKVIKTKGSFSTSLVLDIGQEKGVLIKLAD